MTTNLLERKFYTPDDVAALLPKGVASGKKVAEIARKYGCYRDLDGVLLFTDEDVSDLLRCLRATPRINEVNEAVLGIDGFGTPTALDTDAGSLVVIGYLLEPYAPVWIGWVRSGPFEIRGLLRRVQFGCFDPVAVLGFASGTRGESEEALRRLSASRVRKNGQWFERTREINEFLRSLGEETTDEDNEE